MKAKAILFAFLYIISSSAFSQNYSTRGEIYDYEVGDVFHYIEDAYAGGGGYYKVTNIEITDKYYSPDNDTVYYQQYVEILLDESWPPGAQYDYYSETIKYSNLDSYFIADSISAGAMYNGRKLSWLLMNNPPYLQHFMKYVEGCGYAYRYWNEISLPSSTFEFRLVYFKKGDEEWGTPQIVVGLEENIRDEIEVWVYPNPARDVVNITSLEELKVLEVRIYDQLGRQVLLTKSEINVIDISGLNTGMHYLQIKMEEGIVSKKLIVK